MKYYKISLLALAALMFAACGSSSNDEPEPTPVPPTPTKELTSLKVDYTATVSQQLLDVATVTVRYVGENGQVASEQMSSTVWTKSVTLPLPTKAGLNIQPTLKGSVAEGEYTLSANGEMSYSWLDQDGQELKAGSTESTPTKEAAFYAAGLGHAVCRTVNELIAGKKPVSREVKPHLIERQSVFSIQDIK